jgi:segregation and condensation protein B
MTAASDDRPEPGPEAPEVGAAVPEPGEATSPAGEARVDGPGVDAPAEPEPRGGPAEEAAAATAVDPESPRPPDDGEASRGAQGSVAAGAEDTAAAGAPDDRGEAPDAPASKAGAARAAPISAEELGALQAAEEAKQGDPELDEVESADIEVREEKEEPFEKLAAAARRLSPDRARTVVETLLFLGERPLSTEEIRQATGLEVERIEKALDQLSGHYREGPCGIVLHEVAGGWQLRTSPDNSDFARRFLKVKPQRLTRAALETLAIIAYRQPVTRPEIEDIRGVDCGAVVKALLERRLIKILGKKEEPGRPILYGTSREFLEFFALKDLASLPTLREFHELSEEHRDIVEKEAPEPVPAIAGIVEDLADPRLRAELEAKRAEADAALDELELAMAAAEDRSRAAEAALTEKKPDDTDPDAGPPAPAGG